MSDQALPIGDFRSPIGVCLKAELIFQSAIGNQKSKMFKTYHSLFITHY
jgi:hypothetical protein